MGFARRVARSAKHRPRTLDELNELAEEASGKVVNWDEPLQTATMHVEGWQMLLSITDESGVKHWHLSAMLWPRGRSSVNDDWAMLGRIIARTVQLSGAPDGLQPSTHVPMQKLDPNHPHHFYWHADGSRCEIMAASWDKLSDEAKAGVLAAARANPEAAMRLAEEARTNRKGNPS